MAPEVETHLVNAVLTNGARYYVDHAHPECSTPECADARSVVVFDRAAEQILQRLDGRRPPAPARGPGDRRLQEQLRRQGQQLRLPRELPDGPGRAVRPHRHPHHAALRHPPDLHRRRQGRLRGARRSAPTRCRSSSPSGPTSSRRRSASRPRSSGRSSTPATSPTPTPRSTAASTSSSATPTCSEVATFLKVGTTALVLAMIEDDCLPRAVRLRRARSAPCARCHYDLTLRAARSRWPTAPPSPPSRSSGSCSTGPASTPTSSASSASATSVGARGAAPLGGGAHRPRDRPRCRWPTSSTGWPSTA